jgi:two-component system LytT family sensor kinase
MRASRIVALSLGIGTFFTAQTVLMALSTGRPLDVEWSVLQELLFWCVWAALAPVVLAALRRWPLDATPRYRPILAHVLVAAVLAPFETIVAFGIHLAVVRPPDPWLWISYTRPSLVWGVFMGAFFYWIVVGVYTALQLRERSVALEADLTRARLDALQSQLRPHFLFNTLNAISVLTAEDGEKARRMVVRLGSLLRRSLDEEQHEVPLHQELAFLNEYLDIQRMRFGDRLSVTLTIDPDVVNARVPVLLLQPLVENAIKHGASDDDGTTTIIVRAIREDGQLRLTVQDRGPGPDGAPEGVGLRNTRQRLRALYGDTTALSLRRAEGACVDIRMPFTT